MNDTEHVEYTVEQIREHRALWVEALPSGKFRQGDGQLRTEQGAYCCLGVACYVAKKEGVIKSYAGHDGHPPSEVANWLGLTTKDGLDVFDTGVRAGELGDANPDLIDLNDAYDFTFSDIADVIEDGLVPIRGEYL